MTYIKVVSATAPSKIYVDRETICGPDTIPGTSRGSRMTTKVMGQLNFVFEKGQTHKPDLIRSDMTVIG